VARRPLLAPRRPFYKDVSLQVLAAMLLGVAVGYVWPESAESMRPLGVPVAM
jgi:aerobic C4-dicarboxylate transport protein